MRQRRWTLLAFFSALATGLTAVVALHAPAAGAATPLTVAQALGQQNGAAATVRGYVVGQPTATNTVVRSNYPSDYALALADSASETSTSRMVYVQITSAHRSAFGLKSNPSLLGKLIDATGSLSAYFSHPGLTNTTAFALVGGTTTPPTTTAPTTAPPTTTPPGGSGDYDSTYYKNAIGKTGPSLRSALHTIISTGVTKLSYDQVWDALKDTDQDPANSNNVIEVYSGVSTPKTNNGGGVDNWNREHVWAKSHGDFGTTTGPGTDVHHLRPEDVTVNSTRSNKDFDNGGSAVSQCSGCYSDSDSFEPRSAVKGDVARMVLYMALRYEGDDGWPDLEPNESTSNGTNPNIGKLSVLLQWNAQDPPDTFEKRRNQVIYDTWQHNRNPFIDHPEWAASIWG
ncbi:ribonuclease [Actinokineospora bangkokensis]|uniref:Ribonuclease n=1 Tax=Actinokineospora bangkokensis TaxID=1193682 RepID=A0A1Q9LRF9_9PSEU|nr:endonuclease [Actinokineospora bangkokensis]OLR94593.1 ribonuclease [Actinokineospora bangkokensis]